jgi:hypothetical protein
MKTKCVVAVVSALILVGACSEVVEQVEPTLAQAQQGAASEDGEDGDDGEDGEVQSGEAAPASSEPANFESKEERGVASREFSHSWPNQVATIPDLLKNLSDERTATLREQKAEWKEALEEFGDNDCTSCVTRSYEKQWRVVADLPRFLSLSADAYVYGGGAHGNSFFDALVWDRDTNRKLAAGEFFTSSRAMEAALAPAWCKALKRERRERLGSDFTDEELANCPEISELTVLLGSSNRKTFDRIGLLAAPYVVGSYAEGAYEATVSVTPKVIDAVKPEYRAYFSPRK